MSVEPIHIGMLSGGVPSAYACSLMLEEHGKDHCQFLFTDTKWEDPDTYRFLDEVVNYLGAEYVVKADGRTPPELFKDERMLGNDRAPICSRILKTQQAVFYIEELRLQGKEPILYFGITPEEEGRVERITKNYEHNPITPVQVRFPMVERNICRETAFDIVEGEWGIKRPYIYTLKSVKGRGFEHNNCGGRCIRGGVNHHMLLYEILPDRYQEKMAVEEDFRAEINPDVSFLQREERGPRKAPGLRGSKAYEYTKMKPYTLMQLADDIEKGSQPRTYWRKPVPCECE